MNIKASLMIALIACVMLVGVAAAESPDAGESWSTAKSFSVSTGYNYVSGTLPAGDDSDYWYSNVAAGSTLNLYLDATSYNNWGTAVMYEGTHTVMRYINKERTWGTDTYLNTPPVYVKTFDAGTGPYQFCVRKQ
jgi:hypothetical protein